MTTPRARLLAILKEPDRYGIPHWMTLPSDRAIEICADKNARHRLKRLCEEYARTVRTGWLTTEIGMIGDATYGSALCEEIAAAIIAIGEDNEQEG